MSGFSADWLALREPADHSAVNIAVRRTLQRYFSNREHLKLVDLGCGTGSNFRSLSVDFNQRQDWLLVDYDAQLLAVADQLTRSEDDRTISVSTIRADISNGDIAQLIKDADLVTAAALFDLISLDVIQHMAGIIAQQGTAFYTTLIFDGIATWLPEHPHDRAMREAFNRHQCSDKGFGPATGPDAADRLADAFHSHGYTIYRGKSPWVLTDRAESLRRRTDHGWAQAVGEMNVVDKLAIKQWSQHRETAQDAVTIVGHEDLLALPPDRNGSR